MNHLSFLYYRNQSSPVRTLDDMKKRVEIGSEAGCWNWRGALNTSGYAWMSFQGRSIAASRVAWLLVNGEIPDGLFVLHKCDNRMCINPEHLFLGTNADNMADMVAKGRSPKGRAKLTPESVLIIRSSDLPMDQLADMYGVTKNTVYYVKTKRTWSHL